MGSKKKFSRKNTITFSLVARSQNDPLIDDKDAPQFVLMPKYLPSGKEHIPLEELLPENFPMDILADHDLSRSEPVYSRESDVPIPTKSKKGKNSLMVLKDVNWDDFNDDATFDHAGDDDDLFYEEESIPVEPNLESGFWMAYSQPKYEYDYSKHYRDFTGTGQYVGADGTRDDPLSREPIIPAIPENDTDLLNPIISEQDINALNKDGSKISHISGLSLPIIKPGSKVKVTKDFEEALACGNTNGFLDLEDDFYVKAMLGDEYNEDEDEYNFDWNEEYFEDDEIEENFETHTLIDTKKKPSKPSHLLGYDYDSIQRDLAEKRALEAQDAIFSNISPIDANLDEEEAKKKMLDAEFAALLLEYDEVDDGDIDNVEIVGTEDINDHREELEDFQNAKERALFSFINVPDEHKKVTLGLMEARMKVWKKDLDDISIIEEKIDKSFQKKEKEKWDSESICSTYSNTENIPALIREVYIRPKAKSNIKITPGIEAPMGAYMKHKDERKKAGIARAIEQNKPLHNITEEVEDEEEEEENEEPQEGYQLGSNLGAARSKNETKEEKKARKAAVKAMKAQSRQNKKQTKQLFKDEEQTLMHRQATNRLLGYSVKKLH